MKATHGFRFVLEPLEVTRAEGSSVYEVLARDDTGRVIYSAHLTKTELIYFAEELRAACERLAKGDG